MKLKRVLAAFAATAIAFSVAAVTAVTAGASNPKTDWFEFDKKTGGWIVKDTSRTDKSDLGLTGDANYGHRVQFITYDIEDDDIPTGGFEVMLKLPPETPFHAIGKVRAVLTIDWDNWAEEDRTNFTIISQSSEDSWLQVETKLEDLMENEDEPLYTATVYGDVAVFEEFNGVQYFADWLKVIVTTYSNANKQPVPPVTALVHLLDTNGNVIVLVCPDCEGTPCECPCPDGCNKTIPNCSCYCDKCENAPCKCCPLCKDPDCKDEACKGSVSLPPTPPGLVTTTPVTTADGGTTAAGNAGAGAGTTTAAPVTTAAAAPAATAVPKGGVTLAILPAVMAAGIAIIASKRKK